MKLNELFQNNLSSLSEAIDRDDAIRKIKKLQNVSGRSEHEVENIKSIIAKLAKEYDITAQDVHPSSLLQDKISKKSQERKAAAAAFRSEWNNIKKNWFGHKPVSEDIDHEEFIEILKKFLPFAQKIIKLDKLPKIILRKQLSNDHQPTHGRFYNEQYVLEIAIANRQPVDILRTIAHELVHAKQVRDGVVIDPSTGSEEENEANAVAGIVMRHFNKEYPEYLSYQPVSEGFNNGRKRIC